MARAFPLLCLSLVASFTFACKTNEEVIVVGEVGSLTGPEATFGQSTHKGAMLALKEINAKGGIKGRKLVLKTIDNQGKPEEAATAIKALITRDKVVAVIGEVASSLSLAMAPQAQMLKTPMISPSSTNVKVTEQGDYIFRVCFIDPFQGEVMAKFAKNDLGLGRVTVFRDVASDYSVGLGDAFVDTFKALGGEIVADESYRKGDVDFRAQLTSMKDKNPDAIFVPGYYNDVGLIARQARSLGIDVPLLGGDGWDSPKLHEVGGEAIEGSYFSNHYSVDADTPRIRSFVEAYKARYKDEIPDGIAAQGYDAMMVLALALERAPDLSTASIRDALAATKDFDGVTGLITMDEKRNASKPAVVLKVAKGGNYDFVTSVAP